MLVFDKITVVKSCFVSLVKIYKYGFWFVFRLEQGFKYDHEILDEY